MAWLGLAWLGLAWLGLAWLGLAWLGLAWLGGILSSVLVQQILNRRVVLSFFVQHLKVGVSAEDKTFGTVQITWNGAAVPNLYLSTVELTNESSRDLENVRIKAFTNDTTLLSEFPQLTGTTEIVKYSQDFEQLLAVNPGEKPTPAQWEAHGQRREYLLSVMNRGQLVKLQYLNISKSENQPTIWLEVIHPGVIVKYRHPQAKVFGVPQPLASLAGFLVGILFASLLYAYSPYLWLTAFGALFFGFVAQIPGAYVVKALRLFRRWITG